MLPVAEPGVPGVPLVELPEPGVGGVPVEELPGLGLELPAASVLGVLAPFDMELSLEPAVLASFAGRSLPQAVATNPSIEIPNAIRKRFMRNILRR